MHKESYNKNEIVIIITFLLQNARKIQMDNFLYAFMQLCKFI